MLTKDLIRFKILKGKVKPGFIDPTAEENLQVAETLLKVFGDALGKTRQQLEEEADTHVQTFPADAVIPRGLVKLLTDRTVFTTPEDEEQPNFRAQLFAASAQAIQQKVFATPEDYYQNLEEHLGQPVDELRRQMYADLPAHHPVEKFRPLTATKLLHKYNISLVQWLLLHASQLEIQITDTTPARLRQLLKYLRFNQLLARIEKKKRNSFTLLVDGPMNLFGASRKYGMQLGNFFPALLHQKQWSLQAEVKPKNKAALLQLDHNSGLAPMHERFTTYVPDDFEHFAKSFNKKAGDWQLAKNPEIIPLPGETYCFPDFLITHNSGPSIALELFHPWHAAHLPARLAQLEGQQDPPLLMGIARKLMRDKGKAAAAEGSDYFQTWGFQFNDLPTTKTLLPILERWLESQGK